MKILGLDISSTCTGWSLLIVSDDDKYDWGVNKIILPSYFKGLTKNDLLMTQALDYFYKEISYVVKLYEPDFICAEDINIRHATTMRTISQFHAAAALAIIHNSEGNMLNKIHNATIRSVFNIKSKYLLTKEATAEAKKNKVTPSKYLMVNAINDTFGLKICYQDHDIADACALAWTFYCKRGK